MKKFERVKLETEVKRRMYDHEVLLSFNDDDGAYAFDEWWNKIGSTLFNEFLKEHPIYNHIHEKEDNTAFIFTKTITGCNVSVFHVTYFISY
jgi:hypothetical protein